MKEEKKNHQSRFNKGFYIGLIVTFFAIAIVATVVFLYEYYVFRLNPDGTISLPNLYNMLADVFTIPSVLSLLLYALMFVSKEGAFDAIVYSTKLVFYSIFSKNTRHTKLPATYGEYRAMKMQKIRSSSLFLVFAAIPFFIVGIVFVILAGVNFPAN